MLLAVVFVYSFLAMFVLTSLDRNYRMQRANTATLTLHAQGLMAGSFTMSALLLAYSAFLFLRA